MPQFDFSTFSSQVFWVFVSFLALFALMQWVIVPTIQKIFEKRARAIQENVELAVDLNAKAYRAEGLYRAYVNEAEQEARNMLSKHLKEQQTAYKKALDQKEKDLHKTYVAEVEALHQQEQKWAKKNTQEASEWADTFVHKFGQGGEE